MKSLKKLVHKRLTTQRIFFLIDNIRHHSFRRSFFKWLNVCVLPDISVRIFCYNINFYQILILKFKII